MFPSRLYLFNDAIELTARQSSASAMGITLERCAIGIEPGKWHKVVVEVRGKRIIAQLDDNPALSGESPDLDTDKSAFVLFADGKRTSFDYIRMYEVASK